MLEKGVNAPNFTLIDFKGKEHKLSDFKGKEVILYFYPKDNTLGCTLEAKNFRDKDKEIKERNAIIIGISADSCSSHKKFIEK